MFVTWMRLTTDLVVVKCDGDLEERCVDFPGRHVFDIYPDAEPLFRQGFEQALADGWHNFARVYHGCVVVCLCTREDAGLMVCFKTLPLNGLTESLRAVEAALLDPQADS